MCFGLKTRTESGVPKHPTWLSGYLPICPIPKSEIPSAEAINLDG